VQPHGQTEVLATSDHAHNVFLKYASERGIPSAFFFFLVLLSAVLPTTIALLSPKKKLEPLPLAAFFIIALAGVVAHNLIDYNLQFVGIALPFWLMVGMLVSAPVKRTQSRLYQPLIIMTAFFLLFFTLYEGTNLFLSSRARHTEAYGRPAEALHWYSWIGASLFPRDARLSQAAILLGLGQLPQAEDAVNSYLQLNAVDSRAWRLLGDIYLRWNKPYDGLRAYEQAYRFGKYNDAGILRGLVYLQEDVDRESLIKRRPEFDRLINDYALAIEQNTHFIALSGRVEELVSLCDLMAGYFPEDATLYLSLSKRVMEHAQKERIKTVSRPRGFLW
jgi:hypothetical protein